MSRRSNRRTVKVKQTIRYSEPSSESEDSDDMGWMELFAMAIQHSKRRRSRTAGTSRKRSTPRKAQRAPRRVSNVTSPRARNITVTSTTTVPLSSSVNNFNITTSIHLDDSVVADQSKKVEDKVESFFKAHNLISDDEEDDLNKKNKYPPKDTKEFYELSDSDDDIKVNTSVPKFPPSSLSIPQYNLPSTSADITDNNTIPNTKNDELIHVIEIPSSSKDDELMDIVDKILENTDKPTEITSSQDQSWTDYKNKADEILGNISNLLSDISKDVKPKDDKPEPPKQESPKTSKPSCPVCFEVYGGNTVMMTTTCGHIFCKTCIEQVARTVKKCPTCRKAVNLKKIHPIYL